jgi:hypothetical protein
VLACLGGVQFELKNGVCEKVKFSFWLFPTVFAILQFVNEFYRVRFHPCDFFLPLLAVL